MSNIVQIPQEHVDAIYDKLRKAMELKYKLLDVIYPQLIYLNMESKPQAYDAREEWMRDRERLRKVAELLEAYHP